MIASQSNKPRPGDFQVPCRPSTRKLFDLVARVTDWSLSTVSDKAIRALAEKLSVQLPETPATSPDHQQDQEPMQ